jgi:hypothetical protein
MERLDVENVPSPTVAHQFPCRDRAEVFVDEDCRPVGLHVDGIWYYVNIAVRYPGGRGWLLPLFKRGYRPADRPTHQEKQSILVSQWHLGSAASRLAAAELAAEVGIDLVPLRGRRALEAAETSGS